MHGTAGSGTVRVRPSDGPNMNTDITTTQSIHIKYAWSTAPYNDGVSIVKPVSAYLANIKCRQGYKLVVANTYTENGTTYTLNSSQVQAIYTAAQHWNERLGYAIFLFNSAITVTYSSAPNEIVVRPSRSFVNREPQLADDPAFKKGVTISVDASATFVSTKGYVKSTAKQVLSDLCVEKGYEVASFCLRTIVNSTRLSAFGRR